MKFLRLVYIQYKQLFKDIMGVAMMFFLPIIIVCAIFFLNTGDNDAMAIAIINQDIGNMSTALIEKLEEANKIIMTDEKEALELLDKGDVAVVYMIDTTFTKSIMDKEIPTVVSHRYTSGNGTIIELYDQIINSFIQEQVKEVMYAEYGIDYEEVRDFNLIETNLVLKDTMVLGTASMSLIMILYFMFMSNEGIARSLFKLKETKVLRRLLTTENSQFSIIASFILSNFLFQVTVSSLAFITTNLIIGFEGIHFVSFLLSSSLLSMVSISLSVLLARIFKSESYISMVSIVITIVFFFAGFLMIIKDVFELPDVVAVLIQFSPFYWAYDLAIYQHYLPNVLVLLLFALVFTTAGSYKLEKFIED